MKPKRIQRKRVKGWRMPANTIYVGRGSKWGNPYIVVFRDLKFYVFALGSSTRSEESFKNKHDAAVEACNVYRFYLERKYRDYLPEFLESLKGKDLACWCRLDQPCHADVLLELANK